MRRSFRHAKERQTQRDIDIQTYKQTSRQTDRQTEAKRPKE